MHGQMTCQHLPLSELIGTLSPAQFETIQSQALVPGQSRRRRRVTLLPSVPLHSGDSRSLGSLCPNEVWVGGEKPQTIQPLWLWIYWHKCICSSWHFSLSFHHSTELRVENTFPEKLFFSCTFCGQGKTIIENKKGKKEQKMKGPASHNYSLKCSCTTPELH